MKIKLFGRILSIELIKPNCHWYTQLELCQILGSNRSACYMWCKRSGFKRKKTRTANFEYYISDKEINKKKKSLQINKINKKRKK
mgnify:CR=1 FL=1